MMWGFLKSKVYERKPQSTRDLRNIIFNYISAVPMLIIRCVEKFQKIFDVCEDTVEGHLSDIIFHK